MRPLACAAAFALALAAGARGEPLALYRQHCAACHGADRLSGRGPALLPENLARLKRADAAHVLANGRPATGMPGFGERLTAAELNALVEYIYTPPATVPAWREAEIRRSRVVHRTDAGAARPRHRADPLNLFVVIESGDHHVTILDGDRFEPIHRFASRYALHGGPKFSPDGRYVYFASRDGWISKFDLYELAMVVEVRAGLNTRNAAASADGRYLMVANYLPHNLVLLDAELELIKVLEARAADGGTTSRVAAVYDAAPRKSFVAALKDVPEIWEVSYDERAEPIAAGHVHDYRLKEGSFIPGRFNPRRTRLEQHVDDFFFTPDYRALIAASRDGGKAQLVNLDVRRKIAAVDVSGLPHLASGITWQREGRTVLATPNLKESAVTVVDAASGKLITHIRTHGPGFFLRSHERTRYAWVDGMMGARRDTLQLIDKATLSVAREVTPAPGRTVAHVEFTRDGRYALASLMENEGALLVLDAATGVEVRRIPMKRPVGKYNVHNKITRSSGTSH
jgi:hypothetical protein